MNSEIAEGSEKLSTVNGNIGRQYWEFDPNGGTSEERAHVETLRLEYTNNIFRQKQSSDLLMRMQAEAVKLGDKEEANEESVTRTLRRAISFYSSIQARDGHWPHESAGPLFFVQPLGPPILGTAPRFGNSTNNSPRGPRPYLGKCQICGIQGHGAKQCPSFRIVPSSSWQPSANHTIASSPGYSSWPSNMPPAPYWPHTMPPTPASTPMFPQSSLPQRFQHGKYRKRSNMAAE
ncbi:hypothetical protein ACFE04_014549 [Oxalis oulophora]